MKKFMAFVLAVVVLLIVKSMAMADGPHCDSIPQNHPYGSFE
jgi:hypothetical protein